MIRLSFSCSISFGEQIASSSSYRQAIGGFMVATFSASHCFPLFSKVLLWWKSLTINHFRPPSNSVNGSYRPEPEAARRDLPTIWQKPTSSALPSIKHLSRRQCSVSVNICFTTEGGLIFSNSCFDGINIFDFGEFVKLVVDICHRSFLVNNL